MVAIHDSHSAHGIASAAMPAAVPTRAALPPTSAPAAANAAPSPSTPIITSIGYGAGCAGGVIAIASPSAVACTAIARPEPSGSSSVVSCFSRSKRVAAS